MSRQPTIRLATGDDLTAVVAVGHRTWPQTYGPLVGEEYVAMGLVKWWTQEATIPSIRAGRVLVADVDDEVVAMTSVGPNEAHHWLWKLYVVPELQGQGIGGKLLGQVIENAENDGHGELWTSTLVANAAAQRFYARHGFTPVRREVGGSGIPDSVVLRRVLHPTGARV